MIDTLEKLLRTRPIRKLICKMDYEKTFQQYQQYGIEKKFEQLPGYRIQKSNHLLFLH